jgi:serine/threonine-protein kinase
MVAERYEIDDVIGSGGMSVVYRAHDKKLDRYVTLKVLKEEYLSDENLIERFPREARAAAALNHQNIVSIFDHGRDGDILYITLEYVDGANLKELINKKAPFDDETNLGVSIQIAEGLSEAHANNIIHLDIKPQNILVTTTSIVKVADFGIARAAKSMTLNAAAGSMGSVHYFSPEQARGGYIDHKSDIYSLGIVMYEMATARLPFEGENEVSIALQHINDPLPDVLAINPNVSESVAKIIQKATEKSASKRYQTIDDMTEDLKRALTDASGTFVETENDDASPTIEISEENRKAVRRQKMRQAFLDGVDSPAEVTDEEKHFLLNGTTVKPDVTDYKPRRKQQKYDNYDDSDEYFDDYDDDEPAPTPRDKKADKIAVYGGIILGVILAAGIGFFALHLFNNVFSNTAGMIEIPQITGLTYELAEIETRRLGFVPMEEGGYCGLEFSCENEDCEGECEGYVLFQRTAAGTLQSPGDPLHIVVSLGKPTEGIMPRLTERTIGDARTILDELGMELDIQTEELEDDSLPRDVVIAQYPEPGERILDGDTVLLTVSLGPDNEMVVVPHLGGRTEAVALEILRQHNLMHNSERQESATFPVGQIIRTEPAAGQRVPRNTIVTYFISTGAVDAVPSTPTPTPTSSPDPAASPQPGETTTPQPTDTPAPTPTPSPGVTTPSPSPALSSGTLRIELWNVPEGTQTVHLVILRQIGNESPLPILNDPNASILQFPINFGVQYSDPTIFRIFSVENGEYILRGEENRPAID